MYATRISLFSVLFLFVAFNAPALQAEAAKGSIQGQAFVSEKAVLENGILTLRQGGDFLADKKFMFFLFLDEGEDLSNKSYSVQRTDGFQGDNPHIHVWWKEGEKRKSEAFTHGYDLRLSFNQQVGDKVPGKVSLAIPDESGKTAFSLEGEFTALIKEG